MQHVEDRGHGGARKVWFSRPGGSPLQYEEVISLWRESEGFREEYISVRCLLPLALFLGVRSAAFSDGFHPRRLNRAAARRR